MHQHPARRGSSHLAGPTRGFDPASFADGVDDAWPELILDSADAHLFDAYREPLEPVDD